MRFDALELAIQRIRHLRPLVARLRSRNADAARQIRRAAGSAEEVRTILRVAVTWGELSEVEVREALKILDRIFGICWRLTH